MSIFILFVSAGDLFEGAFSLRVHCVKSVQIRSVFWSVFPCIRTEYGDLLRKIRTRKNSVFGHFSHSGILKSCAWKNSTAKSNHHLLFIYLASTFTLRKKCPYLEFFQSVFSRIRTKYRDLRSKFLYSVRMRENTDQKNSEYGHFLRSVSCLSPLKKNY